MDIYSRTQNPTARGYFPIGKTIIIEMYEDADTLVPLDTTVSFTGNTTDGSLIIMNIADTSILDIGQVLEGAGIQAGSLITDKTFNTITIDKLATATANIPIKAFTPCQPGSIDPNIYLWSFDDITNQPVSELTGYWRMRTADDSYPETRTEFQWGGWPDGDVNFTYPTLIPYSSDKTQSVPRVKGDNIDFIFKFQVDVTGWKFFFVLVDPNGDFELKKGSDNVSGGSGIQISVEASETFSIVIARVLKDETEDFAGTCGDYELQYLTLDDKKETLSNVIVFKDEIIKSDFVIP